MRNVRGSALSGEDRILWNRVARTTVPLPGKTVEDEVAAPQAVAEPLLKSLEEAAAHPAPARPRRDQRPRPPPAIDAPTREKLARGRLPIEARVDLHGMTQAEAHVLLLSFLQRAHALGIRHVLVITGKGTSSGGDGVLRRAVPSWFATAPFRPFVGGFDEAARGHGGGGGLYVRIRRGAGRENP